MANKTLKPSKIHPFDRIEQWSVTALHGVQLVINMERYTSPISFPETVALDVEDDENGGFVGLGIYDPVSGQCYYWSHLGLAREIDIPKFIAHNGISDIRKLQKWGFKVDESNLIWDTQLFHHIIDSSQRAYGLKDICRREGIGEWPSYEEICGRRTGRVKKTLKEFSVEQVAEYNACDCYYTYKLFEIQKQLIKKSNSQCDTEIQYFLSVEKPAAPIFYDMQQRGIRIDVPYLTELNANLSSQKERLEKEIKNELGDINLSSPKQLLEALHAKEIYPELKGKQSTDKRALDRFKDNGIVSNLLRYSELDTLLSSFVLPYLARNAEVVHPNFNQCGTRTGRPSCSNPNLLQIPKKTANGKLVRRMFIPREGHLFGDCDFGQIEPRILAHLSKDENLCELFNDGTDFHIFTSQRLSIDRERAKVLNLSVGYRATFKSVCQQLSCSEVEAQDEIDKWWSLFPTLREWQDKLIYDAKRSGYCTTLLGRRIKVDNLNEYNKWKREHAQRQLVNNICQASAAEIMKLAMLNVAKKNIPILVQVYDELLTEHKAELVEHELLEVQNCMEQAVDLDVPLIVDTTYGSNWADVRGEE